MKLFRALAFLSLLCGAFYVTELRSQPRAGSMLERYLQRSRQAEKEGLAAPFKGITSSGSVQPGLFAVKSTGVSTEPVRKAAEAFLAALSPEQRAKTTFAVDDDEWRKWMNQHFYIRQGVGFYEMSEKQREAAFGLMHASLSAKGLKLSRDIMRLNHTLGELNNDNFEDYGEWIYHITIMGKPSSKEPWGWQIDGHHLIVNYFVLGDQVVMTPLFVGSEPVIATSGKYKGTSILQVEQGKGLAMVNALTEAQRAKAILFAEKKSNNALTEAFHDNVNIDYQGVRGADLDAKQKAQLLDLADQYVSNMDTGHAKVKLSEVKQHLDNTYFAWIGKTDADNVFYYRIHSPVILIEFDHQTPVGIRKLMPEVRTPIREHVHVVVRTPNGNDYGKDLLRQHLLAQKH
jgi:hypothetical protein